MVLVLSLGLAYARPPVGAMPDESLGKNVWFYAWHDEMSGTLRSSVCQASDETQLPFTCRLNVVATPEIVSAAALDSLYIDGIPANELVLQEEWEDEGDEAFTLTVFARPLLAVASNGSRA